MRVVFVIGCYLLMCCTQSMDQPMSRILVFSKTKGFKHESIPKGIAAIQKLGIDNKFQVDTTKNASLFTDDNLKNYQAVVFLSTTGDVLDDEQQETFQRFIRNGGGFVGIHSAADTEYDWPWYNELLGAYFLSHPKQQTATIEVVDKSHPATSMLPDKWTRYDEWYNYKNIVSEVHVLCKLDESSYSGGANGGNHPFAWYREFDGGRSFYTGAGHTDESYSEPLFLQHILGGIEYAMGKKQK
jgi:type 1 glutamine amidotransferase